jgi:cysteine-rich repeat protein
MNLAPRDGLALAEPALAASRERCVGALPLLVVWVVALLAASQQGATAVAMPVKRCRQDCMKDKRSCGEAFRQVFRETKAQVCRPLRTVAERKECLKNVRKALRGSQAQCNDARGQCVACCGTGGAGTQGCSVGVCGNGLRSGSEQCDAGRHNSDADADACRSSCQQPRCGDGVADTGEQCDRDSIAAVCTDPAFASPTFAGGVLRCTGGCTFDTSDCIPVGCGNGVQEPGSTEQCDGGADNSDTKPDACRRSCRKAACGDGVTDTGEQCDDRGANSDSLPDACRTTCQRAHCGDRTTDAGEECDGEVGGRTCADGMFGGQFSGGDLRCAPTCRFNTSGCRPAGCGNGTREPTNGEECDDGNGMNGDGCDVNCTNTGCGNGIRAGTEECDEGIGNSDVAANACRTSCRRAGCGDGVMDDGEQCDQGVGNSDTHANACRRDCRFAHCGDGVKDDGEQCDQGMGNSDTQANACRTDCHAARCGDGVEDNGEECDSGLGNSDTQPNACRTSCRMPACGDGVTDSGEDIDIGPQVNSSVVFCCFGSQSRPHGFGQSGCDLGGCHTRTPKQVQQGPLSCVSVCARDSNGDCEDTPTCRCE